MKKRVMLVLGIILVISLVGVVSAYTCSDSDSGVNYLVKGKITEFVDSSTNNTATDNCISETTLSEYFCPTPGVDDVNSIAYKCPNGCEDGACKLISIIREGFSYFVSNFSCSDFGLECGTWNIVDVSTAGICRRMTETGDYIGIIDNCKNCIDLTTKKVYVGVCSYVPQGDVIGYNSCGGRDCISYPNPPKITIYKEDLLLNPFQGSDVYFSLTQEDLENLQSEGTIKIKIKAEHLQLPEGTPFKLEIYARGNLTDLIDADFVIGIRNGTNAISGIINENRNLDVEWLMNKDDWSKMEIDFNSDGMAIARFGLIIRETAFVNPLTDIVFKSKTGECSGNVQCSSYSKEPCSEIEHFNLVDCMWDEENNICSGEQGFFCNILDVKEYCKAAKCSWRADSFWERFTDWIKSIFGG